MTLDFRTWCLLFTVLCNLLSIGFGVLTLRQLWRTRQFNRQIAEQQQRLEENNQRLRAALRMDGAPVSPCAGCTPCWSGCQCHCHKQRIDFVVRQANEALNA